MRILFDNSTPRGLAKALPLHNVTEARAQGWATLANGDLLDAGEAAGFDVLVTADQNIRYQQNLTHRKIALVVLTKARWGIVKNHLPAIAVAVNAATTGSYAEVEIREPGQPPRRNSGPTI